MTARRLAWSLFTLTMVLLATGPAVMMLSQPETIAFASGFATVQISTAAVGAVVAPRLPGNAVGWILIGMGSCLGISLTATAYGSLGEDTARGYLPGGDIAAWFGGWSFTPVVYGGVVILLHVFPDGRFMSARWRLVGIVSGAVVLSATVVDALHPGNLEESTVDNPVGATGRLADIVTTAQGITDSLALPVFALAAAGLIVRFRRSRGIERQQLKWIAFTLFLVAVGLGLSTKGPTVLVDAAFITAMFGLAAMPVAMGIAVLRYRLYDIDVVINRTIVYGALSATLAAVYLGSVLLLDLALNPITGGSSLAIAASTLTVAALFRPARARIQDAVDRRFFRAKYDAAQTVDLFASHMRDQVDLDDIGTDLIAVVGETVRPSHAALWLRGTDGRS